MTAEIISLGGLDEDDKNFSEFLSEIRSENTNAVFLLEKEDGTVTVGCNFKDKRDLLFAMYRLQKLMQSLVEDEV
jgi:hypothetical protein